MAERRLTQRITPADAGRTVDSLLRQRFQLSGTAVKRAKRIENGILLDARPVYTNAIAQSGQLLSVIVADSDQGDAILPIPAPLSIVYEDADLLVLDKPAPLVVHPGPGHHTDTLANYLTAYYQSIGLTARFHPVNRLDGGTSGLMVVAKHAHAHARLRTQLHTGSLFRRYLAICEGIPLPPAGCIDLPIARVDGAVLTRTVRADGDAARTHYRTRSLHGTRALVAVTPETGRTHQIRVHFAHIGCPLVGDFLYGTEHPTLPRRFALHSAELHLTQPITGEPLSFSLSLPPVFSALLSEG